LSDWATKIDQAIAAVLAKGLRTRDIAASGQATAGTEEMGAAIMAELAAVR
jgi:3-isopropylmalate dehydrogenase